MNVILPPMNRVALDDFDTDAFDAVVLRTPDADAFCSASDWILSAHEAWSPAAETWVQHGEHGYGAFLRLEQAGGFFVLHSFDTMWGFSCPLIGARPEELAREWAEHCRAHADEWRFQVINGLVPGPQLAPGRIDHWRTKARRQRTREWVRDDTTTECQRCRLAFDWRKSKRDLEQRCDKSRSNAE